MPPPPPCVELPPPPPPPPPPPLPMDDVERAPPQLPMSPIFSSELPPPPLPSDVHFGTGLPPCLPMKGFDASMTKCEEEDPNNVGGNKSRNSDIDGGQLGIVDFVNFNSFGQNL